MTERQKEALLYYMEFNLVTFCDMLKPHINEDAIGEMYDRAYGILNDFENTLQTQIDLEIPVDKRKQM